MNISNNRIVVERIEEDHKKEGFEVVDVQDSFIYKARVVYVPQDVPVYMGNTQVKTGDTVLFAKHSPDTHEIEFEGKKLKFVRTEDILAII